VQIAAVFSRQDGKLRASFLTETMTVGYLIQISCFYKFSWLPPTIVFSTIFNNNSRAAITADDYLTPPGPIKLCGNQTPFQ
jgi:hypothetical protein